MSVNNRRTHRTGRVSRLVRWRAMDREEIDTAYSGDICALGGVKDVITGDTLCDEDFEIRLEPPSFPERPLGPRGRDPGAHREGEGGVVRGGLG